MAGTVLVLTRPDDVTADLVVLELCRRGVPVWRAAFAATPRHLFAPAFTRRLPTGQYEQLDRRDPDQAEAWLRAVYSDDSLVIQFDEGGTATSSSSQPTVMAFMLEALDVQDGDTVLEVGTGTG
jgi:protein-L-isoaspartate O-methyltransferase